MCSSAIGRLLFLRRFHDVEHAVLRGDDRREFGEDQFADREHIFLALQHAGELGQVGFEPVLLVVLDGRVLQVADHLVDVVLRARRLRLCAST